MMSQKEARAFETAPYFMESIRLRKWDERAKELYKPLLDIKILKKMAIQHLEESLLKQNRNYNSIKLNKTF